jgi:hypothetical protein
MDRISENMKLDDINALDYFVGGVPAGILFKMGFDDIKALVRSSKESSLGSSSNTAAEVGLIGLVAYFEAFSKNHFASIVNIYPPVLKQFCKRRQDISLNISDLLLLGFHPNRVGFMIAEKFDFGSAKNINNLYCDLLSITPFSKTDIKKYDRLLNDRNLLVHHAGIFTMRYQKQHFVKKSVRNRVFFDSLVINKKDFQMWANFVETMVTKIIDSSKNALTALINKDNFILSEENKRALDFLNTYK